MHDDSMYPDSGEDEKSPDNSPSKSKSKEDKDDNTELVSKKFLGMDEDDTAEEGKICKVRVVKDFGDEVEIAYVKKSKKDKEDSDDEELSADDEIDEIEAGSMKGKSYAGM